MLHRLATRANITLALLAAAAATAGVIASRSSCCAGSRTVEILARLRPGAGVHAATGHFARVAPEFTHLSPCVADDDPRALWRKLDVDVAAGASDDDVLAAFADDSAYDDVELVPEVSLPSVHINAEPRPARDGDSCPISTPSFESYQGYLGPAPQGIDAPAAWRRGVLGQGEQFADIEGGWNAAHEDLVGERIEHVAGQPIRDPSWRAHGTAVLGEVVGKDNARGVVGIAPEVDRVFTSSIFSASSFDDPAWPSAPGRASGRPDVADAIDAAAERLRAGDVLLIELQGTGPRGRYVPMEFWDDSFDAIQAATKRGIVVIEAAGNGYENLDHKAYKGKFDRDKRDSGAIMVGAGGPPRAGFSDRERLDFSNYGARVDVQGWGRMVATLDYGDLQACDDHGGRHYTNQFSGTSSASPIVAGAALLVEGEARARGKIMTPAQVRDLLVRTGTPQAGDTSQHIGPRPDLARAMSER